MTMTHPGLALEWAVLVWMFMAVVCLRHLFFPLPPVHQTSTVAFRHLPFLDVLIDKSQANIYVLLACKLLVLAVFLLIIMAGLFGTPIPERNIATVLTWNFWWAGLIVSIMLLGSAWCAVCPWDTLAGLLVRRRLWRRAVPNNSLNLRVPVFLRNVWPALVLLVVLTWLELGFGITFSPYITATLALMIVVMATISLAVFENKAFCRYFCPVGRTIGFYSQFSPIELRPVDNDVCAECKTLDCYHGTETVNPCPTHLVMGRLKQNTYCTSCGCCSQSCPHDNVGWRLRGLTKEIGHSARPHWDEAGFMLVLLSLTCFHGVSMLPVFEVWVSDLGQKINDSGQLLISFSVFLFISICLPILFYSLTILSMKGIKKCDYTLKKLFINFAFISLPLAFSYHLAHNLNHLLREGRGLLAVLLNPFGINSQPLSQMEKHQRHMDLLIPEDFLYALQAGLLMFGFWISMQVIQHRATSLKLEAIQLLPIMLFVVSITAFNLWLLMQPMVMRM